MPLLSHSQLLQAVAGTSVTRAAGCSGGETISGNLLAGYTLGMIADVPLKRGSCCAFRSGLLLNRWGSRFAEGATGRAVATRSLGLSYIQSPILFIKCFRVSLVTNLILGAGPYAAWRINSPSQTFKVDRMNNHSYGALYPRGESDINSYRRLDYGLSFQCSVEMYSRFNICLQYDHGWRNILEQSTGTGLYKRSITLSFGYYLNRGRFLRRQFSLKTSIANK